MKIRMQQLLKLYNMSYAQEERWESKCIKARARRNHKEALKADAAQWYWVGVQQKLFTSLLINPNPFES